MKAFFTYCAFALVLAFHGLSAKADWPQWRGPNRDGHAAPQELLQSWPDSGPKLAWSAENLGTGYSAVAVVGERLYTMSSKDDRAMLQCLSLATGSTIWEQELGNAGASGDYNVNWGAGQRCTPTIDGNQIFALTDVGVIAALDVASGDVQWSVDLVNEYGGKIPVWGYSESPLVDGDRVVVTPGESNFMIALDRRTGKKVWSSDDYTAPAQYVSVMKGTIGTTSYYVTASKPGLVAFDTKSGEKLFEDFATANGVAVIPTPILQGNTIYHTSAYGAGNTMLKLQDGGRGAISIDSVYALNSKTMENHHGGVVLVDGVIYGFTKQGGGSWMAQDLESGDMLWQERARPNRSGSICYADGRLYCYGDKDGTVTLVKPSRDGWEPEGVLKLPKETSIPRDSGAIWAHPVVAGGKLIIRDQDLMYAFDIAR